jgi:pyruvate,orthophosphate dikinase
MGRADAVRRLRVGRTRTPGRTPRRARRFGGEASGCAAPSTCSSAERRQHVERLILAEDDEQREQALDALLPLQRWDFLQILTVNGTGCPPPIRLLDYRRCSEFLPDITELSVRVALAEAAR